MAKKEHDLRKLPKWAAEEITHLRRQLADINERNRQAAVGETEVFLDAPSLTERRGLPPRSQISFVVDGELIDVHVTSEGLRVGGYNRPITVHPRAANVIVVRPIK